MLVFIMGGFIILQYKNSCGEYVRASQPIRAGLLQILDQILLPKEIKSFIDTKSQLKFEFQISKEKFLQVLYNLKSYLQKYKRKMICIAAVPDWYEIDCRPLLIKWLQEAIKEINSWNTDELIIVDDLII